MADKIPFDEDTMTLIMGLGGPDKPGQHGRTIRDLCADYLQSAGKEDEDEEKEPSEEMEEPEDSEE